MGYYRVEPLRELENIANKMHKFVQEFPESFSFEVGTTFQPRIDIIHNDQMVKVYAELPGISKEQINLVYENNVLAIKGDKKKPEMSEKEVVYRMERNYGQFQRSVSLPFEIQPASINAVFENGVLIITMSKVKATEPDQIKIDIK